MHGREKHSMHAWSVGLGWCMPSCLRVSSRSIGAPNQIPRCHVTLMNAPTAPPGGRSGGPSCRSGWHEAVGPCLLFPRVRRPTRFPRLLFAPRTYPLPRAAHFFCAFRPTSVRSPFLLRIPTRLFHAPPIFWCRSVSMHADTWENEPKFSFKFKSCGC
jgi:hypothetical protein